MAKSRNTPQSVSIKKDVDKLIQTVFHGNGTPSVLNQITKLEGRINTLESSQTNRFDKIESEMDLKFKSITEIVTEKFKNLSTLIEKEFDEKDSNVEKSWSFKTAITTGLLASLTSIIVVLLTNYLKFFH